MQKTTKVVLLIVAIQVVLAVVTFGYFLFFEALLIALLLNALKYLVEAVARIGLATVLLWWGLRIVKRDISTPDNAIVVGVRWWLVGQATLSVLLGIATILPGISPLFSKLTAIQPTWLLILAELMLSSLCGLTGFYIRKITYKSPALK
jgi:hypothetical protein